MYFFVFFLKSVQVLLQSAKKLLFYFKFPVLYIYLWSQVGFAELKETADNRANIGGTIVGAPIVGQQWAQYILTDHQNADYRPMIRLRLSRQL